MYVNSVEALNLLMGRNPMSVEYVVVQIPEEKLYALNTVVVCLHFPDQIGPQILTQDSPIYVSVNDSDAEKIFIWCRDRDLSSFFGNKNRSEGKLVNTD